MQGSYQIPPAGRLRGLRASKVGGPRPICGCGWHRVGQYPRQICPFCDTKLQICHRSAAVVGASSCLTRLVRPSLTVCEPGYDDDDC